MISQSGRGNQKPIGLNGVAADRFLAWPIDSEYAEICYYWYVEDRWSRYSDDTIRVHAWMSIPGRPSLGEEEVCCPENLEIDRTDNEGNYEPSNCRW